MNLGRVVLPVACGLLLVACSRQDRPSIIGHWQAERETFFSAHLPIGPDIVISNEAVSVPATDARISLNGIKEKGNETVLEMSYGVGVSFFFDGPDRGHINVPVLGKIYYRRVRDAIAARAAPQPDAKVEAAGPTAASSVMQVVAKVPASPAIVPPAQYPPPSVQTESVARSEKAVKVTAVPDVPPPHPARSSAEFEQAALAARQGDQDSAINLLNEAFRQGFRSFDKLDIAPEFAMLRSDVRYQALLARYR